ncbi:HET-domain-containing protein [Moniliophthora roreri]|nr:HET-domain-containing protein [Moniliophthora roreri]
MKDVMSSCTLFCNRPLPFRKITSLLIFTAQELFSLKTRGVTYEQVDPQKAPLLSSGFQIHKQGGNITSYCPQNDFCNILWFNIQIHGDFDMPDRGRRFLNSRGVWRA